MEGDLHALTKEKLENMKKLNLSHLMVAAGMLAAPLLTGCSSECDCDNPAQIPVETPRVHVNFGTPAMTVGTRADRQPEDNNTMAVTEEEAKITSLYLYVFNEVDHSGTKSYNLGYAFDLSSKLTDNTGASVTNVKDWRNATGSDGIALPAGNYKFMMLANVVSNNDANSYVSGFVKPTVTGDLPAGLQGKTEDNIKEMMLENLITVSGTGVSQTVANNLMNPNYGGLPMGMMAKEIKTYGSDDADKATSPGADGVVTIDTGDTYLFCGMTFLCSAVRYTFIWDKDNFSWDIKKFVPETVEFTGLLKKYPVTCELPIDKDLHTTDAWTPTVPGKEYLLKDGIEDKTSNQFIEKPFNLKVEKPTTEDSDNPIKLTAYQNLVYLPANSDLSNRTKLTFKCKLTPTYGEENTRTFNVNLPDNGTTTTLQHGYFYDVIGKISSTGADFQVKVKKWTNAGAQTIKL